MKRPVALLVLLTLLCSLTACGGNPTSQSISDVPESSQNAEEIPDTPLNTDPLTASQSSGETGSSNILIAYFTWADNAVVEDPSNVDVDATTSASVLAPGDAAKLASWIQQEVVGGDLHYIVVEEPYSSDYDQCLNRAATTGSMGGRPYCRLYNRAVSS